MRGGRPSGTAMVVAAARGAAGIDPIAARLLPRGFAFAARPDRRWGPFTPFADAMHVRTAALDRAVVEARAKGITQLVVLGAGLDARAWRLPELAGATVFEVDHPSTQRYKRARLDGLAPTASDVRFVRVDFERDDLEVELERAGHDRHAKTVWIWEGVVPYLTRAAVEGTVSRVARRSAPGSVLALTYVPPIPRTRVYRALELFLHAVGEPFRELMTSEQIRELLARHGFAVQDDAEYPELARRLGVAAPETGAAANERALVAVLTEQPSA